MPVLSSDIDTLIAALHPHIFKHLFDYILYPPRSIEPCDSTADSDLRNLVQAFTTLFSFHPGCNAAAATAQTRPSGDTSLYICLSPSTPPEFGSNVDKWLTQFMALRKDSKTTSGVRRGEAFSQREKRFILDTYALCFPAMRQRIVGKDFAYWDVFVTAHEPFTGGVHALEPTEQEKRLRHEYGDRLRQLSRLIRTFMAIISGEAVESRRKGGDDMDMLEFHELCLEIRDRMKSEDICAFLEEYVYPGGVYPVLEDLCLPIELSTLLDLSRRPSLVCDGGKWSSHVLDPSAGARQFSAVMTERNLVERFGSDGDHASGIHWATVARAFEEFAPYATCYGTQVSPGKCGGYRWEADKHRLSTGGQLVTAHPEVTLIQHLLENPNRDGGDSDSAVHEATEAYVACSRTPCYASVLYAAAANEALALQTRTRLAMRVDHPDWCRLHTAEPWILPETAAPEVVARMKADLLRDLKMLMRQWVRDQVYRGRRVTKGE